MSEKFNILKKVIAIFKNKSFYQDKTVQVGNLSCLIRKVKYGDIRHLIAIEKDAFNGEAPWGKTAFLTEINGFSPSLYLIAEQNGYPIAFIGCRFEKKDGHITNVAVKEDFQGNGLGTFLMKEIESYARKNGFTSMSLEVRVSNMDAQRLYRKFGFVSRTVKKDYYSNNGEDALDMVYEFEEKR